MTVRASMIGILMVAGALAGCGSKLEAAPSRSEPTRTTTALVAAGAGDALCVTRGRVQIGEAVTEPTVRAVALHTAGDQAALEFVYRGDTQDVRELASGHARRQLGLKLRAQDGCNVVYVMWRLDPTPMIDVSVKRNAGARAHDECGADGYAKVRPTKRWPVPALQVGDTHVLRAAIARDDLTVWIDDVVAWRGRLPATARALTGPAGLRSDNLAFDLVAFRASPATDPRATAACTHARSD